MDPMRAYLTDSILPADPKEANRVRQRSNWFVLYERILYKRSFAWPLLRYVTLEMEKKKLEELHEGVYSSHIGGHALAVMTIRTGYYWLSLREDAMNLVQTCNKCQKFGPI